MGNPWTVQRLREICKQYDPDIIFLSKTKNPHRVVSKKLENLGFTNLKTIPPHGVAGGGLALLWKDWLDLKIVSSCNSYFDTKIIYEGSSSYVTFVYGNTDKRRRKQTWDFLTSLALIRDSAWLVTGDFNDITGNHEKEGGPERTEASFTDFREFLSEGDLYDLQHSGECLSWKGKRGTHEVKCRLDRSLANSAWAETYPSGRCEYLRFESSDHRPVITYFEPLRMKKKGIFRYDRSLNKNLEVRKIVEEAWAHNSSLKVKQKIDKCRAAIIKWAKQQREENRAHLDQLKQRIEEQTISLHPDLELLESLKKDLLKAYITEENYWKQRSRQIWLHLGDKNTGFFHASTKKRKAINKFAMIENEEGVIVFKEEEIAATIERYFCNLFTPNVCSLEYMEEVISKAIKPCVTNEQNEKLKAIPSAEEIKEALFSIHPEKAPGPDGFSACFFQSNWEVVGRDIIQEVQDFFKSGNMPRTINETHVRLIPKGTGAKTTADYRPIALCNVYYKTISKLLSRRLQPILQKLISETQSAFVPKRAISDNVLITQEVLHYLKNSKAEKQFSMAIKTDMSKAYDRLEWDFIKMVLSKLNFHPMVINWIIQCISTVTYTFIINGATRGYVKPGRGIRQGDPLSPYLFILCSEVLTGLCAEAQSTGRMKGISIASNCPSLNHLLFVDDTMFFCKANKKNAEALKTLLATYESVSGQLINKQKSSIFFSKRTNPSIRALMKDVLGIEKEGGVGKYLGLPEHFGRKKKDLFASVVDRIHQRAVSWSSKFLSTAGKMVMTKSVLAPMSSHSMSCFKLPQSVCANIQSTLTRLWWDSEPGKKKISWVAWDKMAKPKSKGGLGFKDVTTFNDALLAKIGWRILKNPTCLLARCLLGKYCQSETFLKCQAPSSSSHGWRGVLMGRDLLKNQLGWMVGSGESIEIWSEPWLSHCEQVRPFGPAPEHLQHLKVSDLFLPGSTGWDVEKLEQVLPFHKEQILKIRPSRLGKSDELVWLKNPSREFSTRSGYLAATETEANSTPSTPTTPVDTVKWLTSVWNIKTTEKIKIFLWKSLHGALPVGEQFAIRNIPISTLCKRCNTEESVAHLLFHCPFAAQVWELAPLAGHFNPQDAATTIEGWEKARMLPSLPPVGIGPGTLAAWIVWSLWKARNLLLFEKRLLTPKETILKAITEAKEWIRAQPCPSPKPMIPVIRVEPNPNTAGLMSIYTDAAWNPSTGEAGLGWIIDDRISKTQHSASLTSVSSPLMAETLAVITAINFALSHGLDAVSILSDSQILMNTIMKRENKLEIFGVLRDIYSLLPSFKSISFSFINRTANVWADNVAKQALWALNNV